MEVFDVNAADVLGDGTVSYDDATQTLTLNDAKINTPYVDADGDSFGGIYCASTLSIVVKSDSTVDVQSAGDGIYIGGMLTIQGNGVLKVQGLDGIYCGGDLLIIDASVDATATGNPGNTIAANTITIQNSNVTTEVDVPYGFSNGLDARSAVNIINSTVLARGYAYGIASDISISIRGENTVLTAEAE